MKIGVLLSGGVDSSVVLADLATNTNHQITAYYLKIWLEDELSYMGDCPWQEDLAYARAVCEKFNVPLKVISLQTEYHERVVEYTLAELRKGLTPSPDIFCNQMIKFGAFWDKASGEVDLVASGHYASTRDIDGYRYLLRGVDAVKDQSYFLSFLSQEQLKRSHFSLGKYHKTAVRELARQYDLPTKERKDSQGICFLGKIKYNDFVEFHLGQKSGPIIDIDTNAVLGEHDGYWYHTIGQRKGLGLGSGPWYVYRKDVQRNIVYVRHATKTVESECYQFRAIEPNWLAQAPDFSEPMGVKLRHGPTIVPCEVRALDGRTLEVSMSQPDRGIASGQFAVFYRDEFCLGAAKIYSF